MRDTQDAVQTRRSFLTGSVELKNEIEVVRPPWTTQSSIAENCTSCGLCLNTCPENILFADKQGKPELKVGSEGCTFCRACANACDEDVFDLAQEPALPWIADLANTCLLQSGVSCQICTDTCEAQALHFNLRIRPVGAIELDPETCTGCGACVATCPTSAIVMIERNRQAIA